MRDRYFVQSPGASLLLKVAVDDPIVKISERSVKYADSSYKWLDVLDMLEDIVIHIESRVQEQDPIKRERIKSLLAECCRLDILLREGLQPTDTVRAALAGVKRLVSRL